MDIESELKKAKKELEKIEEAISKTKDDIDSAKVKQRLKKKTFHERWQLAQLAAKGKAGKELEESDWEFQQLKSKEKEARMLREIEEEESSKKGKCKDILNQKACKASELDCTWNPSRTPKCKERERRKKRKVEEDCSAILSAEDCKRNTINCDWIDDKCQQKIREQIVVMGATLKNALDLKSEKLKLVKYIGKLTNPEIYKKYPKSRDKIKPLYDSHPYHANWGTKNPNCRACVDPLHTSPLRFDKDKRADVLDFEVIAPLITKDSKMPPLPANFPNPPTKKLYKKTNEYKLGPNPNTNLSIERNINGNHITFTIYNNGSVKVFGARTLDMVKDAFTFIGQEFEEKFGIPLRPFDMNEIKFQQLRVVYRPVFVKYFLLLNLEKAIEKEKDGNSTAMEHELTSELKIMLGNKELISNLTEKHKENPNVQIWVTGNIAINGARTLQELETIRSYIEEYLKFLQLKYHNIYEERPEASLLFGQDVPVFEEVFAEEIKEQPEPQQQQPQQQQPQQQQPQQQQPEQQQQQPQQPVNEEEEAWRSLFA